MPHYIAFLRAMNVGGHSVKMERLRHLFESLEFTNVETFIASGNVIFETPSEETKMLETKIEARLKAELGYDVATFIRTPAEVAFVSTYQAFPEKELSAATALNVGFITDALDELAHERLMALKTDIDDFHVHNRVVYWLCRKKQSESTFSNALFEKALKLKSTWRSINTINRLAAKYPPSRK